VRTTSPSRRAAGLLAVTTIGLSTAVLSVTGVASAEEPIRSYVVSSNDVSPTIAFEVAAGTCGVQWSLDGAPGDDDGSDTTGAYIATVTQVTAGQEFVLTAGLPAQAIDTAGGATTVTRDGVAYLSAAGGGAGTAPRAASATQPSIDPDYAYEQDSSLYAGSIIANLIDCPQEPWEPELVAGDGVATLSFYDDSDSGIDGLEAITGYEYKLDSGDWVTITTPPVDGEIILDIAMSNGVAHEVFVRSQSAVGPSAAVSTGSVTPFAPIGAPTITSVKTGTSLITVTWAPPTVAGTYDLAGYDVGYSGGDWGNQACATDASVLSCTFTLPAGPNYSVTVYAVDAQGNYSERASQSGVAVPGPAVPTAVPTKDDGDLVGPSGPITQVTAGQTLTLQGAGFGPNSTVQLTVFSAPVSLATVVADENGAFSVEVVVPAGLENGVHHLVASGVDAAGNVRNLVIEVTVSGGVPALAYTGFTPAPYIAGGLVALLAGAGLLVASRRRSA
jgi:hypothetical protein